MENPIQMDDLGGTTIFGNIHIDMVSLCYFPDPFTIGECQ